MKLEDFVEEQEYDLNNACLSKSYHVIGTCSVCRWWHPEDMNHCWNRKMYHIAPDTHYQGRLSFEPTDGCIHWENKNET